MLIYKHEVVGLIYCDDSKVFIEDSIDTDDIYGNIEEYNLNKEFNVLIVFDDMIADILSNKNLPQIVTK